MILKPLTGAMLNFSGCVRFPMSAGTRLQFLKTNL